jgi:hypothetical protein
MIFNKTISAAGGFASLVAIMGASAVSAHKITDMDRAMASLMTREDHETLHARTSVQRHGRAPSFDAGRNLEIGPGKAATKKASKTTSPVPKGPGKAATKKASKTTSPVPSSSPTVSAAPSSRFCPFELFEVQSTMHQVSTIHTGAVTLAAAIPTARKSKGKKSKTKSPAPSSSPSSMPSAGPSLSPTIAPECQPGVCFGGSITRGWDELKTAMEADIGDIKIGICSGATIHAPLDDEIAVEAEPLINDRLVSMICCGVPGTCKIDGGWNNDRATTDTPRESPLITLNDPGQIIIDGIRFQNVFSRTEEDAAPDPSGAVLMVPGPNYVTMANVEAANIWNREVSFLQLAVMMH